MLTSVLELSRSDARSTPSTLRIGLLGLGTVGSAVARLAHREAATFETHGLSPAIAVALVRDASRDRDTSVPIGPLVDDVDAFLRVPVDIVVEALGGLEPARTVVAACLERGTPVVTANKTLIATHGAALAALARRRGTALRFEASCIAGVPFLGTFEHRPLASRVHAVAGILNGTSNAILTAIEHGAEYGAALADAQARGYAEPDPSADVTGADAAQKLAILVRLFGRRLIAPSAVPATSLDVVKPSDLAAARRFVGRLKPLAVAAWPSAAGDVSGFVAPAFVPEGHPLASVSGVSNGVVLEAHDGRLAFTGPGAGPDVTAATLLDDVLEVATEGVVRPPAPETSTTASIGLPWGRWFVRLAGSRPAADVSAQLAAAGISCEQLEIVDGYQYALTGATDRDRLRAALAAGGASPDPDALTLPALPEVAC